MDLVGVGVVFDYCVCVWWCMEELPVGEKKAHFVRKATRVARQFLEKGEEMQKCKLYFDFDKHFSVTTRCMVCSDAIYNNKSINTR